MITETILVPFGNHSSGLKALYHSFALADRFEARIRVLFFRHRQYGQTQITREKVCREMVNRACEAGMDVSFHIVSLPWEEELLSVIKTEHIDLVVLGAGDTEAENAVRRIRPRASVRIIKVEEKKPVTSNHQR